MKLAKLPVALTATEKNIFDFLLAVNERYALSVTLRVAGGWVRDRLLGGSSDDIDIALEGRIDGKTVTGELYCDYITKYQNDLGLEVHGVGVIPKNPDQSKHLETATTHIFGESVDFVNLRCEEYTDSRIPTMRPGTPLEDAQRRDFTINALFYNIHTESVEDFTSGLEDLEKKLIRTPLCPRVTLLDDPLRLLRCVRFACRYDCQIAENLVESALQDELKLALRDKVSRERVGIELRKMLLGPDPSRCFSIFSQFGVANLIFEVCKCDKKGLVTRLSAVDFLPDEWENAICYIRVLHTHILNGVLSKTNATEAFLAAVLITLKGLPATPGQLEKFLSGVVTHGLKLSKKTTEIVQAIIQGAVLAKTLWNINPVEEDAAYWKGFAAKEERGGDAAHTVSSLDESRRVVLCETMQMAKIFESEVDVTATKKGGKKNEQHPVFFWKEALVLSELITTGAVLNAPQLIAFIENAETPQWAHIKATENLKMLARGDEVAVCIHCF